MNTEVVRLDLRLRRRSVIGFAVGMALYLVVIVVLYPTFKDETGLNDLTKGNSALAALFGASGSLTSPVGWLNANAYANFLPLIVLVITLGYGASCVAGQDEDGTLSMVVTLPRSRRQILIQKAAVLALVALPTAGVSVLVALLGRAFDLDIDVWSLIGTTLAILLLGVGLGGLAMFVGALTGARGEALGTSSAVAAAMYLISSLAPVTDWIHPLRYLSLFYWSVGNQQLANGVDPGAFLVLVVVAAALLVAAALAFDRLDVQ